MNSVQLMGNLTMDPKVKRMTTGSGVVTEFTVAVTERYATEGGQAREETSFIACFMWGARGEAFAKFHRKGERALVWGRLKQRSWQDPATGKYQSKTRVEVTGWDFVTSRAAASQQAPVPEASAAPATAEPPQPPEDDDVPF